MLQRTYSANAFILAPDIPSSDVVSTFTHLVTSLKERYPALSYLHVTEPRLQAADGELVVKPSTESNDFLRNIWGESYIATGGFNRGEAIEVADKKGGFIAMGRFFIANVSGIIRIIYVHETNLKQSKPDLPRRFREDLPLNKYDRSTFYVPGNSPAGYIDYPFYKEDKELHV